MSKIEIPEEVLNQYHDEKDEEIQALKELIIEAKYFANEIPHERECHIWAKYEDAKCDCEADEFNLKIQVWREKTKDVKVDA